MVERDIFSRGYDDVMILFGGIDASFFAPPAHHGRIRRQPTFEDLIPADDLPAFGIDVFFYPLHEIALQLILVFQPVVLDSFLAFGAGLPTVFGTFVPADMNVLRR